MPITANDTNRKSWLEVPVNSDFPIQNIPFGVFLTKENIVTVGTRIGDSAIDLGALQQLNYFEGIELTDDMFIQDTLNDFISDGKKTWRLVRNRIAELFDVTNSKLQDNPKDRDIIIFKMEDVEMQLPVLIGDYTDFYSSKEHATNVGKMFRDAENALLPNWLHIPVGYHGRALPLFHQEFRFTDQWDKCYLMEKRHPYLGLLVWLILNLKLHLLQQM